MFSVVGLGMPIVAVRQTSIWPLVLFCGFCVAWICAYVWLLIYVTRRQHRYRLRLLPDGLRLTEFHHTTNWREPQIVKPEQLLKRLRIRLAADSVKQPLDLELKYFDKSDRLALIEHCSQFLTPEQQIEHGKDWIQLHSRIIAPPKPNPLNLRQALLDLHLMWLAGAVAVLLLIQTTAITFPAGYSVWTPTVITVAGSALGGLLAVLYGLLGLCWFGNWRARQATLLTSSNAGR